MALSLPSLAGSSALRSSLFGSSSTLTNSLVGSLLGPEGIAMRKAAQDQANAENAQRWAELKDKSATELAAMGIEYLDGSFFKNGIAYLTKNDIDTVTGKYAKLLDASGNYIYDWNIPTDIMAAVVEKYGDSKSKQELEEIARATYNAVKSDYNASTSQVRDDIVQTGLYMVANKYGSGNTSTYTNAPLASNPETSSSVPNSLTPGTDPTIIPGNSASAKKNNNTWLFVTVGIVVVISIVIIIKYK